MQNRVTPEVAGRAHCRNTPALHTRARQRAESTTLTAAAGMSNLEGDKVDAEASNDNSGGAELELLFLVSDGGARVGFERRN